MVRRSLLVYNPASGRQLARRLLAPVVNELSAGGFEVEAVPTAGPGDATRLAQRAVDDGCEVVFAMGGDGTLRETAVGLLGTPVALGVLPAGTVNVLSRALGLPRHALEAARVLPRCAPQEIDVGLVGTEPFLMMASRGVDAVVMQGQFTAFKKRLGRVGVGLAAPGRILKYGYPELRVRHDGKTGDKAESATMVVVSNIPHYGGGFRMAPDADFQDGLLDLVRFRGHGTLATASFVLDVLRGRHLKRSDISVDRVTEVEIDGPPEALVQIDGDVLPVSRSPLTVSLSPRHLTVLMS